MVNHDEEVQKIFEWMAELDRLAFLHEPDLGKDANWVPTSAEGLTVFARLTAPENREGLRKWYARFREGELNPCASNLRSSLERTINEDLD